MDNQEEVEKIKQQTEEVKILLTTTKQEILEVEKSAHNAKQIISTIEAYGKKLEGVRALVEDPESGVDAHHRKSKTAKEEIDILKNSSDEQLNKIKATLVTVQDNIRLMNEAYVSFEELNSKIKNPDAGLAFILAGALKKKEEIDILKNSSDEQLNKIKATLVTVQDNIRLMNEAYVAFVEIKTKIENPQTGLAKILETSETTRQEIVALKKQSEIVFQEIKKFRDESHGYTKEIEDFKNISEGNKDAIEQHKKESEDLKGKIEKIYKIATDAGLANSFDERKKGLIDSTKHWLWALIGSTSFLSIALFVILWPIIRSEGVGTIDSYTWYRLTLTSPIIFFIAFASVQYNKERSLLEKYAFKAATALSLEGYTTLLINTFGKDKDRNEQKILNFVLSSMSTIYQEPYEPIKESRFTFGIDSKFASFKGDLTKTMEETKDTLVKTIREEVRKTGEDTASLD